MKNYRYGDVKNPKVVTDYYARRQVNQMRNHFLNLATRFLNKKDSVKTINLLNRAVEKIPLDVVLGFGDDLYSQESGIYFINKIPNSSKFISSNNVGSRKTIPVPINPNLVNRGGSNSVNLNVLKTIPEFQNGNFELSANGDFYAHPHLKYMSTSVHRFFNLYLELNEIEKAKKVLNTLLPQYESVVNYFIASDLNTLLFSGPRNKNADYLITALNALHEMHEEASSKDPNGSGAILEKSLLKLHKKIDKLFSSSVSENDSDNAMDQLTKIALAINEIKVIYGFNI